MPRPKRLGAVAVLLICLSAGHGCGGFSNHTSTDAVVETGETPRNPRQYGGDPPGQGPTDEESSLKNRAGIGSCKLDPRLTFAARIHARDLAKGGRPEQGTGIDHIRFALLSTGCGDYNIQPMTFRLDNRGIAAFERFAAANTDNWNHCGIGVAREGSREWGVFIGVDRKVELDAVPVISPARSRMDITGKCNTKGSTAVQAFLGMPDGTVVIPDTTISVSGQFTTRIFLAGPGKYELEIQTDSGMGAETAVLIPLYVDVDPDPRPVVAPDSADLENGNDPRITLTSLVNTVRARAGAPPVKRDSRLDSIAASHSADMIALGYFGHRSPRTGLLADRLKAHGLFPATSAENVARSSSLLRTHRNLVGSPSHRIKIVDPQFTHVGVGVLRDGEEVVVTEIFARW